MADTRFWVIYCIAVPVVATALLWFGTSAKPEACKPAASVRITIDDVVYSIPASLFPRTTPEAAVETQRLQKSRGSKLVYCEQEVDQVAAADSFSLSKEALVQPSLDNEPLSVLMDASQLVVHRAPPSPISTLAGGELVEAGLFRRLKHVRSYKLQSTSPLLYGSPVHATCGPASRPRKPQTDACRVYAELPRGSLLSVDVLLSDAPLSQWPALFMQIERLIGDLSDQQ